MKAPQLSTLLALLENGWQHPHTGNKVSFPVELLVSPKIVEAACARIKEKWPAKRLLLVQDSNTAGVVGNVLARQLRADVITLPAPVSPTMKLARELMTHLEDHAAWIAVGSGTINDLVKYASSQTGTPYVLFGTAPSMNGYLSATASLIMEHGLKQSHKAHLPALAYFDLDILTKAPKRLIAAGVGDTLCRSTAQIDWLLSHHVLGTEYIADPFDWVMPLEKKLIDEDKVNIPALMEALLLSGLGMTVCGGSHPASQGEHMLAHTMELLMGDKQPAHYHGEEIAVTTLIMAKLQERLFAQKSVFIPAPEASNYSKELPKPLQKEAKKYYRQKHKAGLERKLQQLWPVMAELYRTHAVPVSTLEQWLKAAGAPTKAEALGWPEEMVAKAVRLAPLTRDRFTSLDAAMYV